MTKYLITLAVILGVCVPVEARTQRSQVDTYEMAYDTAVVMSGSLGTTVATNVTSSLSVFLGSATAMEVYNQDSSNYIVCGFSDKVTGTSTDLTYGREIAPKTGLLFQFNFDKIDVWCRSLSAGAATVITTIKMR